MFRFLFLSIGLLCLPTLALATSLQVKETPIQQRSLAPGSQRVPLLFLQFDFPCDQKATILDLTFRHSGAGAPTDFSALYLLDANGERRSAVRVFSSHSGFLTLPLGADVLSACDSNTLTLAADIRSDASPSDVHRLTLTHVTLSSGEDMHITHGTPLAAEPARLPAGSMRYEFLRLNRSPIATVLTTLHRFQLVNETSHDQELRSIHFTLGGTIREADLVNLELRWHSQLLEKVDHADNGGVSFLLLKPFVIPARTTLQFAVVGVVKRHAYGTLSFSIRDASDIVVQTRRGRRR